MPNKAFAQTGQFVQEMINVDKVFSNFMNDWNIPGGSIAIVKDGRLIYARGFGYANKESNERMSPDHLFRIASVSKSITSIAIMKLIDEGAINVDAKVFGADGLLSGPNYNTILDPSVKNITVRHLLHHTSGWGFINKNGDPMFLNRYIAQQMGENPPVDSEAIIQFMLTTQTLNNEPGTNYFYSNFGFCILGRIIEHISGKSYENYVKTELLNPLGISEMQLGRNLYENKAPNEVKYYDSPGAPLVNSVYGAGAGVPFPYSGFNIEAMDSHGGWIASAIDLVKLLVAVDGYDTKPDILNQAAIRLMTTPSTANSGYGMGWAVNPWGNWWHAGDLPGTSSILVRTSNGLGWAVLFNTRPSNLRDFRVQMDNMVWEAIKGIDHWPTHDLFEQAASVQQDSAEVPQDAGTQPKPETFTPSVITAGQITFSELMFATSGGLFSQPQWIELFNNGPVGSEPVNLRGSKLVIEARDSETKHRYSTIVFEDLVIKPKWTVLLVTRDNSRDSGHLPEHRVYSLSDHSNVSSLGLRDNAVLPASGFSLKLFAADGTLIDSAGNLDGEKRSKDTPAWELPTGWTEDRMRTSLIRRYEDGTALPGTEAMSWLRAADVQITTNTYYGHKADIGNPGYRRGGPLPVVLSAFRSERVNAGVIIEWTTESETDNAGFNILRSQTKDGSFVKVNPTLIPGAGTTAERNNYTWTDTTAKPNVAYYYQIEDVSLSGDRQRLATVRMKGYVSASDKLTTTWSELKVQD
ncbi:MAG: serine hydrolase [Candidatus Poribacteria bacterium]|nr:serine hydrolase [Candidatus Poribacteria bacterium]